MEFRKHLDRKIQFYLSMPFIYGMIVPVVFADICTEVYHQVAFRLYDIDRVRRKSYIKIDRHKLKKLNIWERVNCVYCGYVNGWLAYGREIAARTEKFWCGIKHEADPDFVEPDYHKEFENRDKFN